MKAPPVEQLPSVAASTTTTATTTTQPAAPSDSSTAKEEDLPSFRDKKKFFEQEIQGHTKQKPKDKGRKAPGF